MKNKTKKFFIARLHNAFEIQWNQAIDIRLAEMGQVSIRKKDLVVPPSKRSIRAVLDLMETRYGTRCLNNARKLLSRQRAANTWSEDPPFNDGTVSFTLAQEAEHRVEEFATRLAETRIIQILDKAPEPVVVAVVN